MKLILGDCFDHFDKIGKVDHVFTSPPYNRKRNDKYSSYDDRIDDYFSFLKKTITECLKICNGYLFLNLQKNYYNKQDVFKTIGEFNKNIVEIIIWEKSNPMPASGFSITNTYEMFLVFSNKPLKSNKTYTKNIITTSVNNETSKSHKAIMKQEVSDWFIKNFTKEKEIIFDPFMGLGTTGLSCKNLNRDFIGVELIDEYYKIACGKLTHSKP